MNRKPSAGNEARSPGGADLRDTRVSLPLAAAGRPASQPLSAALERLQAHTPNQERYELVGELARGGMGIVQRVWDGDLGRTVARKILGKDGKGSDSRKSDPRTVGRFLEEAQITAQLEHPGIVPVHELGLAGHGVLYFTMRLVRGEDLYRIFEKVGSGADGWNTTRALGVLLKACDALCFAHGKGVIHRDLKPSNLMVGRFGEVYVMDWGLARVLDQPDTKDVRPRADAISSEVRTEGRKDVETPDSPLLTRDGDVLGTPAYMSPEQARGELERIGPRTDVYALGAMLYHLLSGHVPYLESGRKLTPQSVLQSVLAGPPAVLAALAPTTSPELLAICEKAMARALEQRYQSVQELADDLRAYLEQRVVRAYRSGPLVELVKWVRRNRLSATSLASLLVVLVTTGFSMAALESRRRAADLRRIRELSATRCLATADTLWPLHADRLPAMDAWLEEARSLLTLLPASEAELAAFEQNQRVQPRAPDPDALARKKEFETAALEYALAEYSRRRAALMDPSQEDTPHREQTLAVLELEIPYLGERVRKLRQRQDRIRDWRYSSPDVALRHERLAGFVEDLRALADETAEVERRRSLSLSLRARSTDEHAEEWSRARTVIADRARSPLYAGLDLQPQLGLVPLGPDPDSGLWEFWHVLSGAAPVRGPDGGWLIRPETGIVLVLVPGGVLWMGSQDEDPAKPNYFAAEPGIDAGLGPIDDWLVEVEVEPFLLSKYELTQAQWLRMAEGQPSENNAGYGYVGLPCISRTHPLESVAWLDAERVLARYGLELPTEAQWERAARAGTQAKYATGPRADTVVPLADLSAYLGTGSVLDGFPVHAPVDSPSPSAWGFHGLFGNVREWCRDWYGSSCERGSFLAGSGEHVPRTSASKACRGGSFRSYVVELRASSRTGRKPASIEPDLGVRPARSLEK